jgi:Colicin V production protein
MLNFLTVVIIGIVCYAFWREGLLTACSMFINVIIAGLVAFSFWEPLANEIEPTLTGFFLEGYEDCLCLILIFSLTLGLLRLVTNTLAYTVLDFHPLALQGGAVFFGALTGYLVAGFLVCAIQTLPMPRDALQLEYRVDPERPKALRHVLPPDRVWLAMMHRAGLGPFAWDEGPTFDPHGNFALRYARYRRLDDRGQKMKNDGALPAR